MATIILWTIFYIITGIFIIFYFIKEKYVTNYIYKLSDKILDKLYFEKEEYKEKNKVLFILNILAMLLILFTVIFVDKTPNEYVKIKIYALIALFIINAGVILLRKYDSFLIITNIVIIVAGQGLFNINDKLLYFLLFIMILLDILIIYIDKDRMIKGIKSILNGIFLLIMIFIIQNYYIGNFVIPTGSMIPTIEVQDRIFSNNIIYKFKKPSVGDIIAFKEPVNNRDMYTKRITGKSGDIFTLDNNNEILLNGENSELNRKYSEKGLLFKNNKIYIPKKGDEVSISYIIKYDLVRGNANIISKEEFLANYTNDFNFSKDMHYPNGLDLDAKYVYIMTIKGKEDYTILPILDFKEDKDTMLSLLRGNYIILKDNYYMAMGDNTDNSFDSRYFGYISEKRIKGRLSLRWMPFNRIGFVK